MVPLLIQVFFFDLLLLLLFAAFLRVFFFDLLLFFDLLQKFAFLFDLDAVVWTILAFGSEDPEVLQHLLAG